MKSRRTSKGHKFQYWCKSYDEKGVELSGGQLQKITIARALAKPAGLLIMDESASALDPLAEAEIYENFNSLAENRMAIYISHRMTQVSSVTE